MKDRSLVRSPLRKGFIAAINLFLFGAQMTFAGDGASRWSWQQPQAKVLPTGDLEWAPQPFEFKPGPSARYIDFEVGADSNDGLSREHPWQHHPWDKNAT